MKKLNLHEFSTTYTKNNIVPFLQNITLIAFHNRKLEISFPLILVHETAKLD